VGWRTKEFNGFLQTLFPTVFQYLGTINPYVTSIKSEPDDMGPKRIYYSWPYVLLKKDRKKHEAVDCTHTTASTYQDNLSGDGAHLSFHGKAIYLSMSLSP